MTRVGVGACAVLVLPHVRPNGTRESRGPEVGGHAGDADRCDLGEGEIPGAVVRAPPPELLASLGAAGSARSSPAAPRALLRGRVLVRSVPDAVRHVHRAVAEATLVDELEVQAQIGGEGRLARADHDRDEDHSELIDDTGT